MNIAEAIIPKKLKMNRGTRESIRPSHVRKANGATITGGENTQSMFQGLGWPPFQYHTSDAKNAARNVIKHAITARQG